MKNWIGILLVIAVFFSACSNDNSGSNCITGEGPVVEEVIDLQPFIGIELRGGFPVTIKQGETQTVTVRAQQNIINLVQRNVLSGIWPIELGSSGCIANFITPEIEIVVPDMESITNLSSAEILVENFTEQSDLNVTIAGSGGVNLGGFNGTRRFNVIMTGSGDLDCTTDFSDLERLDILSTGSGNYNGFEVRTDTATIGIRGSGNSNVFVNNVLNAQIIGSGSVFYKGNPEIIQDISGSGQVVDAN